MGVEQDKIDGNDAKWVVSSKAFKTGMERMKEKIESLALQCDPTNQDQCQRIIVSMQIQKGFERELIKIIEEGEIAEIQFDELEPKVRKIKR